MSAHHTETYVRQCDNPWHLKCLNPPLDAIPDGEWFCPDCEDDLGGSVVVGAGRKPQKRAKKNDVEAGQKRKAPGKDKDAAGESFFHVCRRA